MTDQSLVNQSLVNQSLVPTTSLPGPAAAAAAAPGALHVLFTIGDAELVVPASDVLHTETFTGATKVPGTAPYVAGLVQIRHRVIPVVDVRVRFGLDPKTPTLDSRVIVVQHGERAVGLLVDRAREVIRLAPDELRPPPDVVATDGSAGFIAAVAQTRDRLLMLIDLPKLIGDVNHGR